MDIPGFHVPAGAADGVPLNTVAERNGVRVHVPALGPVDVARICEALITARAQLLTVPLARVIDAVDAAARRLREGDEREQTVQALAAITGYSAAMADLVLRRMSQDWGKAALQRLVRSEFGDAAAIEGFAVRDGSTRTRVVAPPLGLHIFSGNVPGVSVTSIVRGLLVRSAVLGKTAVGEPVLAPRFARFLADADPLVGACVAVTWWRGGNVELEAAALEHAGLVVHYGGADAIASLRSRAPAHTRFVEHGPKISFVLVRATDDLLRAAADTAEAVAVFDQQGCVSPQLAYVVGTVDDAMSFADAVGRRLAELAESLPRAALMPGEAAAVHELRTRAEFRAIRGEDVALFSGDRLAWTVIVDPDPVFEGTCLNRTLIVKRVDGVEPLLDAVRPFGSLLQTVGAAGFEPGELDGVASSLAELGVTRVAPIADMPWPPVDWHHDGRGPLRELVRFADLEA